MQQMARGRLIEIPSRGQGNNWCIMAATLGYSSDDTSLWNEDTERKVGNAVYHNFLVEICALPAYYAAYIGNSFLTFRGNISVRSSKGQ